MDVPLKSPGAGGEALLFESVSVEDEILGAIISFKGAFVTAGLAADVSTSFTASSSFEAGEVVFSAAVDCAAGSG